MVYRHEKTGAVIDVNSKMGGRWKPVEESSAPPKSVKPAAPKTAKAPKTTK